MAERLYFRATPNETLIYKEEFIEFRTTRDSKLSAPRLLLPSIQVNILAGKKPEAEDNGVSYLKLPITE